jgi:hypothetical protein
MQNKYSSQHFQSYQDGREYLHNRLWFRSNAECVQNADYESNFGITSGGQSYLKMYRLKQAKRIKKSDTVRKKIAPMKRYNCKLADSRSIVYNTQNQKLKEQCHEVVIFEGLYILISTFCVCADGFQGLSKAFHYPLQLLTF